EAVPAEVAQKEFDIAREKAREEGKPEEMLDKIAQGRMNKFYQESTLLEQAFIKDGKVSVANYLKAANKDLTATDFKRVTLNVD
ncbi:MAG: translation elongation factor Ts, partial [Bacteroidales bacterium]